MAKARRQSIDVYRGLALLAMAAYHASWDLNYYGLISVGIGVDPVWITLQRSILTAFLLLAGASLALAHGEGIRWRGFLKREAMLVAAAAAVSVVTWFQFGEYFAYFGVLHMIALGSLLALPLVIAPLWVTILVAIVTLTLPILYTSDAFNPRILDWIGFFRVTPETADLVPLFPWFGVMLIGVIALRLSKSAPAFTWQNPTLAVRCLTLIGRWSLVFYLVHQPLLFGIITPIANYLQVAEEAKLQSFTQSCKQSCGATPGNDAGYCTAYCLCALDMTVRDNLWDAPMDDLQRMGKLCQGMSR